MKIAISVNQEKQVSTHFGKSKTFDIYQVKDGKAELLETRNAPDGLQSHDFEFITDCDVVISGSIGCSMQDQLKMGGIVPFVTDETDPLKAIALFIEQNK